MSLKLDCILCRLARKCDAFRVDSRYRRVACADEALCFFGTAFCLKCAQGITL